MKSLSYLLLLLFFMGFWGLAAGESLSWLILSIKLQSIFTLFSYYTLMSLLDVDILVVVVDRPKERVVISRLLSSTHRFERLSKKYLGVAGSSLYPDLSNPLPSILPRGTVSCVFLAASDASHPMKIINLLPINQIIIQTCYNLSLGLVWHILFIFNAKSAGFH